MNDARAPRCPVGVIAWRGEIICYRRKAGEYVAVALGNGTPLELTDELLFAIVADVKRPAECEDNDQEASP